MLSFYEWKERVEETWAKLQEAQERASSVVLPALETVVDDELLHSVYYSNLATAVEATVDVAYYVVTGDFR